MDTVKIAQEDRAKALAALYNASRVQGMGFIHAKDEPMTVEQAEEEIKQRERPYFDYLHGKVMKVDLSKDEVWLGLYDRDNGDGAGYAALKSAEIT